MDIGEYSVIADGRGGACGALPRQRWRAYDGFAIILKRINAFGIKTAIFVDVLMRVRIIIYNLRGR